MKLELFAIGKLKKSPTLTLLEEYQKRISGLSKGLGFKSFDITQLESKKNLEGKALKNYEADLLLDNCPDSLIALDETGKNISSHEFARLLDAYKNNNHNNCRFLIGGADGLANSVKQRATHLISFGAMTWPHMMVRVMLAEQIYRAMTILSNHPYHRGD